MKKTGQKAVLAALLDFAVIAFGNLLLALAILYFIKPHVIPLGGVSGIALVLNHVWALPVGVMTMLVNLPLFAVSFRVLGRHFLLRTMFAVVVSSLAVDLLPPVLPEFIVEETLLASLYGGFLMGLGLGLVFARGATSGGSDIVSKLIHRKKSHMSVGRLNLVINFVIIAASAVVFRNAEAVLYALIVQFVSSATLDAFLNGMESATAAFIITGKPKEVSEAVMRQMKRGTTAVPATGMFSGESKTILICAVRRHEMTALKKHIVEADPTSFMILTNANEVLGRGFKSLSL
jgi:uncharacterized membrane-anchored protein YitT (DUF2179 family)